MNPTVPTLSCSIRVHLPGKGYGVRQPAMMVKLSTTGSADKGLQGELEKHLNSPLPPYTPEVPAAMELALSALHWSVALQQAAGLAVFGSGRLLQTQTGADGVQHSMVLIPFAPGHAAAAQRALEWVAHWIGSPFCAGSDALAKEVEEILQALRAFAPTGKNALHFLRAAHTANIPWDRVAGEHYQFGWGARSRLMLSSFTDRTSALGADLARHKYLAAAVLRRAGLPAPPHALVKTVEEAVQIATGLGYPVVVKPADTDGGVGVAAGLQTEAAVRRAFEEAALHSAQILVEKHFQGQDYRLLVFNGKLIWTVLRQPGGVTGNGRDTIGQLLEHRNQDPRRDTAAGAAPKMLALDSEAFDLLAEQQHTVTSVPALGEFIRLRRAANVAMGGIPIAANSDVHPDNQRLAEQAAQAFGLDLAGIDLLIPDISKSWYQSGAAICEVNAQPQFGVSTQQHLHGDVLKAIVPHEGRIPTVVVLGSDNEGLLHALQTLLAARGWRVGLASAQGAFLDGVQQGQLTHVFSAAQALLFNKDVDALIVNIADAAVLNTGLPMDAYDVLILASDLQAADSGDALARVLRMLAPHRRKGLLVNASDARCVEVSRAAREATLIADAALLGEAVMSHLLPQPV